MGHLQPGASDGIALPIVYKQCYNTDRMSPKQFTAFRIDDRLLEAMRKVRDDEGIPVTLQVEMAVREWLKRRGVEVKSDRKRASTRKRP